METAERPRAGKADSLDNRIKEITEKLEQGIKELFGSDRYKTYLDVMSRFYEYSFNNCILIAMQRPDATHIAGYTSWTRNFGRHVNRGETGIRILAPAPYKKEKEITKTDPATRQPILGSDGKPVTEKIQVIIPAYKVTTVFDISQTEGKELPTIADDLKDDVYGYISFMDALRKISPVPIEERPLNGNMHGYYHLKEKKIVLKSGMSQMQTMKTCIHEIAHAILHDKDTGREKDALPDGRTREVEAESVAYTVCRHYGIDTSDYSFGYIGGWSKEKELQELKSSLGIIRSTAADIISSMDQILFKDRIQDMEHDRNETKERAAGAIPEHPAEDITRDKSHGRHR